MKLMSELNAQTVITYTEPDFNTGTNISPSNIYLLRLIYDPVKCYGYRLCCLYRTLTTSCKDIAFN